MITFNPKEKKLYNIKAGQMVRKMRKLLNLNQTEMCKKLGIMQAAMSRVENGGQGLSAYQMFLLSEIVKEGLKK